MSIKYSHPEIAELMKNSYNTRCIDCNSSGSQWVSLNNGVFLCLECSGIHRGYGVNISYIKSITLDTFADEQILYLKKGGNEYLIEFLNQYGIFPDKINDKEKFYKSKVMSYYRRYLSSLVNGKDLNEKAPNMAEALQPAVNLEEFESVENKFSCYGSINKNENDSGLQGTVNNLMDKAVEGTKNLYNKAVEMDFGNKIKDAGKAVYDKGAEIIQSETVQNIAKKTGEAVTGFFSWAYGKWNGTDSNNINNNNQ